MAVGWMWHVARQKFESDHAVERKLEALKESIPGLNNVVFEITRGTTTQAVLDVSDQFDADLLVLSTHGVSTEDHTSITEQILNRGRSAVLVLHDADRERVEFALEGSQPVIVVPTDLSADANAAVAAGAMLARALSAQLHLVRLVPELPTSETDRQRSEDEAFQVTRAFVPEDFVDHVVVDLERGIAIDGIVDAARRLSAACIVMGEQTRLAHGLLHRAPCPVFYVPPERARGTRPEQAVAEPSTDESALEQHGLKILVAIDGSPASDSAVAAVANRPWPAGTEFEVLCVVHENTPTWFDPAMVVEAAYADRVHRVEARAHEFGQSAAERIRRGIPGATVTDVVIEGEPADVIVQEAREWGADLIMMRSDEPHVRHARHSVSAGVAMDAPCSVEVVRPADNRAQAAEENRRLRQRDETTAFRGKIVGICSWEHPEMSAEERQRLCGNASPIVDAHGRIIRRQPPASDEQRES
jgi:nucleotide-binding universal stress UspA family protein